MYSPYTPPQSSVAPLRMAPRIKWWMLVYSVIFAIWLALCATNSILADLSLIYTVPAVLLYIFTTLGNILYAVNRSIILPSQLWRAILVMITLEYFLRPVYGNGHPSIPADHDMARTIKTYAISIALFIPTAWAHYASSRAHSPAAQ